MLFFSQAQRTFFPLSSFPPSPLCPAQEMALGALLQGQREGERKRNVVGGVGLSRQGGGALRALPPLFAFS
jgi:hypothetical protein